MYFKKKKLHLYLVVSEELGSGYPPEPYRIAELVVARNPSQARYLAWKADEESFTKDIREIPKMRVCRKESDVPGPVRIASYEFDDKDFEELWSFPEEKALAL